MRNKKVIKGSLHIGPKGVSETTTRSLPTVSVIVPCRNEEDRIEDCIRSILHQESLPGGIEIIVADGMSSDRTRDILRSLSEEDDRLKVIDNPGLIVSTGLNGAISAARGKIIIRMDAHSVYPWDYIRQCVEVLRQTGADNVGGARNTIGDSYVQKAISAACHSAFAVGGAQYKNPGFEGCVDTVPYGCWSREIFGQIGVFDEELVRNQDDEFNLRLIRAGGKIWQSTRIRSWYVPRGSLCDLFRQYRQYGYWKVRIIQKHKLPGTVRQLVPASFVLVLTALTAMSLWWSSAAWGWIGLLGAYLACSLGASIFTASRKGWTLFPLLPVVFACFHFAYGIGFLRGVLDFFILRRQPARSFTELTRTSPAS